jgi:hypothetical protein
VYAHDVGLIVRVNVLSNGTQRSSSESTSVTGIIRYCSPDSGDANFSTLGVLKEAFEEFEERLEVLLETLDDGFQDSIKYVDTDFAVCGLRGRCGFVKEWEKLGPSADGDLYACDNSDNTGRRMANKGTGEEITDQQQK